MPIRACILSILWLLGSAASAAPFTPADAFGAREQLEDVSLSPDGTRIAYIVPTKGQGSALLTTTLAKDAKPTVALVVSGDPDRLGGCNWVSNDRLVCTIWGAIQDALDIMPFSRVVSIDANAANPKMLSKELSSTARGYNLYGGGVIDWLPEEDGMVLMIRNQVADDVVGSRIGSSKEGVTVEKVNTRTLATTKIEQVRDRVESYISDRHGTVRIMGLGQTALNYDSGVTEYSYRKVGSRDWNRLSVYDSNSGEGFYPLAIDYERNAAYGVRKKDGRRAIFRLALDGSMNEELIYARPDVDVDDLISIGRHHRVVGVSYATDARHAVFFAPELVKLTAALAKSLPNQPTVRIVDSSVDEKKLLIWAGSDDDPGVYYVLDRVTREMAIFQPVRPQLEGLTLAKVQSVTYRARDGVLVPGYLTLPPGSTGKNLPALVMPHGGPSARDEWGFDWLAQYFANRGYAVLQPNFRGSSGYGDAWLQDRGFKSWRMAINDVNDAGGWLVEQGIANPAKLGILGWSYGGYAALQSSVIDPDRFKAIVAIAPVTDFNLLKEQYRYWSNKRIVADFVGSGPNIKEGSPAQNAGRIKAPVLLVHGTLDRNVAIVHSRTMDSRLRAAGSSSELITFEKLDHYLDDGAARTRLLLESDRFLRKAMGM